MNNDEWDDDEELSNEEIQAAIQMAVGELLNIASMLRTYKPLTKLLKRYTACVIL